jgi:hypothetical protein
MMKKFSLLFLLIAAAASTVQAQSVKDQLVFDQQDRALLTSSNLREEGTPLLTTTWLKGLVKFTNGNTYKADFLKYDLEKDQLYFKDTKSEDLLQFSLPVSEFSLIVGEETLLFKSGFAPIDRTKTSSFYQVLSDGGVQLLKRRVKQSFEERAFNSATTTRSYKEDEYYYLAQNNVPVKIKKDKKQVFAVLANHAAELEVYFSEQKLNLKNEEDLISLIIFYNSL